MTFSKKRDIIIIVREMFYFLMTNKTILWIISA